MFQKILPPQKFCGQCIIALLRGEQSTLLFFKAFSYLPSDLHSHRVAAVSMLLFNLELSCLTFTENPDVAVNSSHHNFPKLFLGLLSNRLEDFSHLKAIMVLFF